MDRAISARRPNWMWSLITVGVLLVGLFTGSLLTANGWSPFGRQNAPFYTVSDQRPDQTVNLNSGFSAIAKAVTPAVVTIVTSSRVRPQQSPFPFFDNPFWDFFRRSLPNQDNDGGPDRTPRQQMPRGRLQPTGLGSGVIVSPDGYILTNNHVIEGAEKVEITLPDRRQFTAKIVGSDPPSDVAVLRIESRDLPSLPLGDSEKAEVGDVVLAVGNPLGIGQTVTMGIISAKGRSTNTGSGSYENFLQTDAAINRGNSGGALVNMKAELIGIPSQILSQTGGNIGIGFAIPSAIAKNVMDQLVRGGKVRRGKLGVTIGALTTEMAEQFGYKSTQGALVQDVEPGSSGERAGIKPGDIITEYQGQRIADATQLRNLIAQTTPGTTVRLKVWREGSEREVTTSLAEMNQAQSGGGRNNDGSGTGGGALAGVTVRNLTPDVVRQLNLPPSTRGVVIDEVDEDSNAAAGGLQNGDVIEEVNRQPISNLNDFNNAVQKAGRKNTLLRVRRAAQGAFYIVVPAQ